MSEFELPHNHGGKHTENFRSELCKTELFSAVSDLYKQLGDPTRLRIFWLLCHQEECVINIAALLNMSPPSVSHYLRTMHEDGLLLSRRDGKEVYYKVSSSPRCVIMHDMTENLMDITCPKQAVDFHGTTAEVIENIHEYLTEHLSERITIDELSRQFLINPTTLKQEFKKAYGNSVAAHIKGHRMERAAQLLAQTDKSISDIAKAVGYGSQSRFTAAFKDVYNTLPKKYRNREYAPTDLI